MHRTHTLTRGSCSSECICHLRRCVSLELTGIFSQGRHIFTTLQRSQPFIWKLNNSDSKVWCSEPTSLEQSLLVCVPHMINHTWKCCVTVYCLLCIVQKIARSSMTNSGDIVSPLCSCICLITPTHAQKTHSTSIPAVRFYTKVSFILYSAADESARTFEFCSVALNSCRSWTKLQVILSQLDYIM